VYVNLLLFCHLRQDNPDGISVELGQKIQPFYDPFKKRSNESLSATQLAWFRHFCATHKTDSLGDVLINTCIMDGIKDGVWRKGWTPEHIDTSFPAYIYNKIKNARKEKKSRLSLRQRLDHYVESSLEASFQDTDMEVVGASNPH